MENGALAGLVVPITTPVDTDDRVDEAAFRRAIRRLMAAGVDGIFVGGSAGEGPLLVPREWERMVTIAYDEVGGALPLLGGAIDTSTRRVLDKLRILRDIGYPFCVVTPTYYITLRAPGEYLRLFEACAEQAGSMALVAYNIPSCVGSVMPADGVIEMARRGWIRYCKESSGNYDYLCRLVSEGAEVGLKVFQGEEPQIAKGLLAGAVGIVPVCANFAPELFLAAYRAAAAGDEQTLAALQARILQVRSTILLTGDLWIAGIKYAVSRLGYGSAKPVAPLQPLTEQQQAIIDRFIAEN